MDPRTPQILWVIAVSFVIALALTAMPLPEWASAWRPAWVGLVLMYWCIALPHRVGIASAWCIGLLVDVLNGSLLGQHALGLTLVAYLALRLHQRIRVFPLGQQAFIVGAVLTVYLSSMELVHMLINTPLNYGYLLPAITSMALWPWLFIILRDVRRKAQVS